MLMRLYLLGNLPFYKIHVNFVGEGPLASLRVLRHFLSLISRLLVAI